MSNGVAQVKTLPTANQSYARESISNFGKWIVENGKVAGDYLARMINVVSTYLGQFGRNVAEFAKTNQSIIIPTVIFLAAGATLWCALNYFGASPKEQ